MRLSIMSGRTLRGKSWKSCLNWLVFLGSLDQSLRAKFKLMLLTVAFGPGQQDWNRREEKREACHQLSPATQCSICPTEAAGPNSTRHRQASIVDGYG